MFIWCLFLFNYRTEVSIYLQIDSEIKSINNSKYVMKKCVQNLWKPFLLIFRSHKICDIPLPTVFENKNKVQITYNTVSYIAFEKYKGILGSLESTRVH